MNKIRKQLKAVSNFKYFEPSHSKCSYFPKEDKSTGADN